MIEYAEVPQQSTPKYNIQGAIYWTPEAKAASATNAVNQTVTARLPWLA